MKKERGLGALYLPVDSITFSKFSKGSDSSSSHHFLAIELKGKKDDLINFEFNKIHNSFLQ